MESWKNKEPDTASKESVYTQCGFTTTTTTTTTNITTATTTTTDTTSNNSD